MKAAHRFVGLAAAIPLLLWALTGLVFLTKPGYEGAYERLSPRTYPMIRGIELSPPADWREMRQQGNDSRLIDTLYRIHYLQWLGEPLSDKMLGFAGLVLLIALLASGITMQLLKRK